MYQNKEVRGKNVTFAQEKDEETQVEKALGQVPIFIVEYYIFFPLFHARERILRLFNELI